MSTADRPGRTLVLVGMMGVGKTSTGRRVAKRLDRPFVDCDEGFVARYGRTVAEVFAHDGEAAFRNMEVELLSVLLGVGEPLVVAAGGGVVSTPEGRRRLSADDATVVYLSASLDHLVRRAAARAHRPLLAGSDPGATIGRLYAEREAWYRQVADEVVDVEAFLSGGRLDTSALADHVAELAG